MHARWVHVEFNVRHPDRLADSRFAPIVRAMLTLSIGCALPAVDRSA
jgi:hypothetical protein